MDIAHLHREITDDPALELERQDHSTIVIKNKTTGNRFEIDLDGLTDATWSDVRGVLLGERDCRVMTQITRIVGYYSQLQNWNRSKLAELRDRHKGNYNITGTDREQADQ